MNDLSNDDANLFILFICLFVAILRSGKSEEQTDYVTIFFIVPSAKRHVERSSKETNQSEERGCYRYSLLAPGSEFSCVRRVNEKEKEIKKSRTEKKSMYI